MPKLKEKTNRTKDQNYNFQSINFHLKNTAREPHLIEMLLICTKRQQFTVKYLNFDEFSLEI